MKRTITKFMAFIVILLFGSGGLNAQSHLAIAEETTIELTKVNILAAEYITSTDNWAADKTYCGIVGDFFNMSSTGRVMNINVSNVASFDIYISNSTAGREFKVTVGSGTEQTLAHGGGNCESFSFSTNGQTGEITIKLGGGGSSVYPAKIVLYPPSTPSITSFTVLEVPALVNETAKTITAELPYGTSLTAITPVVTVGGTATGYSPTGAQDFSNSVTTPVVYTATDGTNNVGYAVTLTTAATASDEKEIINLKVGGYVPTFDSESFAYSLVLPADAAISQAVSFELSVAANATFTSGTVHDFTTPLTITVTAQDASTQAYTLSVTNGIADIAYVVNINISATDTKVYPMLVSKGYYVNPIHATGADLTQFADYDLVVLNEEPSSSNSLAVAMSGLIANKPFLNLKAYMYGKTGWPSGAGNNGTSDTAMVVTKSYLTHPIFSGVTFRGDSVDLFPAGIAGNAIQGVTNPGSGKVMTRLVSNPALASIIEDNTVAAAKYLMIPISNVNYGNLTANALKIIENAVSYLMSDTKFAVVAPQIALTQGSALQAVKVGTAIQNIVYTLTNADGAAVTGLPNGVEGVYADGVMTISGTVPDSLAAEVYDYTVTATGWPGYDGAAVTATGKITLKPVDALDVYYMIGGATVAATDLVYPYLSEKPNMLVTTHTAATTAPEASVYDAYDLVVVHESVGGNNVQLVALKSVDKPILNFKSFCYTNGRWSWGAPNNGLTTNQAVTVKQPTHPIFDGVDAVAAGTVLEILSAVANSKGIQPADVNNLPGSINVATAPKVDGNMGVAIHDVPAAVRGVESKYIMIPIFNESYQYLNATAFKLIDNAIDYLFSTTQFAVPDLTIATFNAGEYVGVIDEVNATITVMVRDFVTNLAALEPVITLNGVSTTVTPAGPQDFTNSLTVPVVYTVGDMINKKAYNVTITVDPTAVSDARTTSYFYDGQVIQNPVRETLKVYDISGRMIIESNENISMKSFSQGVYIIRAETSMLKITL